MAGPRLVEDDGTGHEPIVVIGEAPGAHENAQGKPFVGPSGWKMLEWMRGVGLSRRDAYWTNVYPYQPPGNNLAAIPPADIELWTEHLHDRIANLADPVVIVPTGNTALRALIGKSGITKHRGSIYGYQDRRGRLVKVIPTLHPAAVLRTPAWERRCRHDWRRIASDATFRDLRLPRRHHFTRPTLHDVECFVAEVRAHAERLAIDIETPGGTITCVGFSYRPDFSITIPTTRAYWQTDGASEAAWQLIKELCELPVPKVTHNGHYDAFWLAGRGIRLETWDLDTLALHHAIDATEDHALAYCASIDTREPYWKDEAKDPEEAAKYASNLEAFWIYNGKDAAVTRELADVYVQQLQSDGRMDFYLRHYRDLFVPVLRMMQTGIRMDNDRRIKLHAAYTDQCRNLQETIGLLAGGPLHSTVRTKKQRESGKLPDLSSTKVRKYLYETLKLPTVRSRSTGKPTADEVTIRQLMIKYGTKPITVKEDIVELAALIGDPFTFESVGKRILEHRRTRKLMEFLDEGLLDDDEKMRYTFKFTTDTGRFSCGKSPTMHRGQRTGRNVQNIDRELRGVFLPEPGHVFVEVDLSQAEDRIVKMLSAAVTGNVALRERARAKPWENDEHRRAASSIFSVPIAEVTRDQRQMGKSVRHATNYDMHGRTMSDRLLKDGIIETPQECERMINVLHAADPDIREWHKSVRQQVLTHRCLVNSWGRMMNWEYDRLNDDVYRAAYAFVPQSEVPAIVNQYGLVPLTRKIEAEGLRTVIHLQGHDSLLMSCPPNEVWPIMAFLKGSLERPRRIGKELLTIWTEFSIGATWGDKIEFKKPFGEEDVRAALAKIYD